MKLLTAVVALVPFAAFAADPAPIAAQLDELGRIASVMVDGDVCERILTARARGKLLNVDPRDQWAAADNFDVDHQAYTQIKKTLIRLGRLGPPHTDVNLWMPVQGEGGRVQILIRNVNEISQFWKWGELHQPATAEMTAVLRTGKRLTITGRNGFVSILAPVSNSLGDVVGFVEVVSQVHYDPRGNVK
jgi:hypothetical protein